MGRRSPLLFAFPFEERGPRQRRSGTLVNDALETIFPALFHTARTLSGSLCSPPSPRGEGGPRSGTRVLSLTAHLRRSSSLFFIPPEPYPARSARHLPLEGKALSIVILFLYVSCIRFDDARKAASSYRCLPHWGRGTAQRRSGAFVNGALETIFPALFHTASTLSGSLRSPPSPRGEGFVGGIIFSHMHVFALTIWG